MKSSRITILTLIILCAALAAATAYSFRHARELDARLQQTVRELEQSRPANGVPAPTGGASNHASFTAAPTGDAAALLAENARLKEQIDALTAAKAAQGTNAVLGANARQNRQSFMARLQQQDPERYKQIVAQREERRKQAEQSYQDQMDQLAARAQSPATPEEANLVGKISDTLDQINQLRQKMQDLRNSSNPDDPATQAQMQQTSEQMGTAFQQLNYLRNQDRTMQYQQLATSLGLTGDKAETLTTSIPQILQNTQYRPQGGGGSGPGGFSGRPGGGGTAGNTGGSGTTQSSSTSTTTTR